MTAYRGYAAMSPLLMWFLAFFLGLVNLFDVTVFRGDDTWNETVVNLVQIPAGLFMLYCAIRAHQGKRALLESRAVIMTGHLCFGLVIGCLAAKLGSAAIAAF